METVGDIPGVMEGGLGREATEKLIFGGSGIVPAAIVAILLNMLLPREKNAEKLQDK